MSNKIKLIVGLGNPGSQYEQTRHNAGFWFIDELAKTFNGDFKAEKKYFGDTCNIHINGHDIKLIKPMTFMNLSGQGVAAYTNFFKLTAESILVAHDELDFPAGKIRLKSGGGHGGHNGLRDIIARLGSKEFMRLRIGIDHPGSSDQVTGYVLGKPSPDDRISIENAITQAIKIIPLLAEGEQQKAMQALHNT